MRSLVHKVTYIRALLIQPRMEHFLTLRAGLGASSSRALLVVSHQPTLVGLRRAPKALHSTYT